MTSQPSPQPKLQKPRSQHTQHAAPLALCVASVFALGGGFYAYTQHHTETANTHALAHATPLKAAAQLSMISLEQAPKALERTPFDPTTRTKIMAALQRGDMRLAQLPLLDDAGTPGQIIDVTSAGITQRIVLTGSFQPVLLPITTAGAVTITPITPPHNALLSIIAMTALGPQALPSLTGLNQAIELGVIVQ
ncbi:hypothetical protein [Neokomagataea anthophila]|uniref:SAF domain-containing protein n=1 Tax=Neokomagataea anthophila TaxID=2826925 RepID=A0ABS5E7V7_9PROT|nr:hypothetical protein [Neokomagataea anthophila]MBR0559983.1 hypothetical protein [Neokomagataea anthophila]